MLIPSVETICCDKPNGNFNKNSLKLLSNIKLQTNLIRARGIKPFGEEFLDSIEIIKKLFTSPDGELSFEFIQMIHEAEGTKVNTALQSGIVDSQNLVYEILGQRNYDLIGVEGLSSPLVTTQSAYQENQAASTKFDMPESQFVELWRARDGALRYVFETNSNCMGLEEPSVILTALYLTTLIPLSRAYPAIHPVAVRTLKLINELRSRIAFAKIRLAIQKQQSLNPCIIMGTFHEEDFQVIVQETGTTIHLRQTTAAEFRQ